MGLRSLSVISVLAVGLVANAQTNIKAPPPTTPKATASVSGRVFGITQSGDLKPARMAHIYLVYKGRSERYAESTASATYKRESLKRLSKALEDHIENMKNHPEAEVDENLECRSEMVGYDEAMLSTMEWVQQNKKLKQLLTTDADEEGAFQITNAPAGAYTLVARGQAGANDALEFGNNLKAGQCNNGEAVSPRKIVPSLSIA